MTKPAIVLVHSPFVGPSSWAGVADVLRQRGFVVVAPSLAVALRGDPPHYPAIANVVADAARPFGGDIVLVVHSGAGRLLDAVVERLPVAAAIFVDAVLPCPESDWLSTVPQESRSRVLDGATDGLLQAWHTWFPPAVMDTLLSNAIQRAAFIAEIPRVPLTFAEEVAPAMSARRPARCAYLRLSPVYEEQASVAEQSGWPTRRQPAHHLAIITNPAEVTDALVALCGALGVA